MQIFSAEQIRAWDEYTILHEPVSSIDLMERAATQCVSWLERNNFAEKPLCIYCGKGNNGGDGLAIARLLSRQNSFITVYILEFGHKGTEDFQVNLARLHQLGIEVKFIQGEENIHPIPEAAVIIDALYGSGLNRPLEGVTQILVNHLNQSGNPIISIDIPSGMYADRSSLKATVIRATHTLSFQCYKPAFLVAENALNIGELHLLDIGLHPAYLLNTFGQFELIDAALAGTLYHPRLPFAHKGNFGHALLVAGSYGKTGAAVLAAKACLRSGVGLLTCHIPRSSVNILQTASPEAMVIADEEKYLNTGIQDELDRYDAIGIGPGIGTDAKTRFLIESVFKQMKSKLVLDADALNILAANRKLLASLPPLSVLTPHPKEFERLAGKTENDFEQIELALDFAKRNQCILVLKGHHTFIAMPGGKGYFNTTGNAGMAKGGSGDVLTGMCTAFLAQGYPPEMAALLAVYLHGYAGDLAAAKLSQEAMLASDLIDNLGGAFFSLRKKKAG